MATSGSTGVTKIFAGAGSGEGNTKGMYRSGLFLRNPGAGEWQAVRDGLPENVEVRTIAVSPHDANVMFVGTQDGPYRSIDGGMHWEKPAFPDKDAVIWTMSVHPTKPNIVYAGAAPVALYRRRNRPHIANAAASIRAPSASPLTPAARMICMWPSKSAV